MMYYEYYGELEGVWCDLMYCYCNTCVGCSEWDECEDAGSIDVILKEKEGV